jgi:hypothetical protein
MAMMETKRNVLRRRRRQAEHSVSFESWAVCAVKVRYMGQFNESGQDWEKALGLKDHEITTAFGLERRLNTSFWVHVVVTFCNLQLSSYSQVLGPLLTRLMVDIAVRWTLVIT